MIRSNALNGNAFVRERAKRAKLEAEAWAQRYFGGCELGDVRRTRRVVTMATSLARHVGRSPHAACRGDAAANEGAYRLLRNESVDPRAMAEGGFAAGVETARRCPGEVLALEDTTTLGFEHAVREELGDLGGAAPARRRGFHVHTVLLVEASSGHTLGLGYQRLWCREESARGQRHRRKERAYEDKESVKWERASRALEEAFEADMARVVSVCDREADVYEYLEDKQGQGQRFVVRAAWDRRTTGEAKRLFAEVEAAPVLGEHRVAVPQRAGRKARTARLELRGCEVQLREPRRRDAGGGVRVNALLAHEVKAAKGEEALRWLILTGEPVADDAQARRALEYYTRRWRIEEFHKAWKSGTRIEHSRLQTGPGLERLAVILAFVAVRLLQLREALEEPRDGPNSRPCDEVQGKVLWLARTRRAPPEEVPTLRWAYEALAKLGGWGDTKRTGRAGWQTLWEGWLELNRLVDGYRIAQQLALQGKM